MESDVEVVEDDVIILTPGECMVKALSAIDNAMDEVRELTEAVSEGVTLQEGSILVNRFWKTTHLKDSILLKLSSDPVHNSNVLLSTPFEEKMVVDSFNALQVVKDCVKQVKEALPGLVTEKLANLDADDDSFKRVLYAFGEISSECFSGVSSNALQSRLLNDDDITLSDLANICYIDNGNHVLEEDYVGRVNKQTVASWVSNLFTSNTLGKAMSNLKELKAKVVLLKHLLNHVS